MALGSMSKLNSQFSNRTAQKGVTVTKSTDNKVTKFHNYNGSSGVRLNSSGRRSWTPAVSYKTSTVFKELQKFRFMLNTNTFPVGNMGNNLQAQNAISDLNALYNSMGGFNWDTGNFNYGSGNKGYDTAKMITDAATVGLNLADTLYRIFNDGKTSEADASSKTGGSEAAGKTGGSETAGVGSGKDVDSTGNAADPASTTRTGSTSTDVDVTPGGTVDTSAAAASLGSSVDVNTTISNMKSCPDSQSLRSSIGSAQAQLSEIDGKLSSFPKDTVDKMKEFRNTAENNVDKTQKGFKQASNNVSNQEKNIEKQEAARETQQNALDKAVAGKSQAEKDFAKSVRTLSKAQDDFNKAVNDEDRANAGRKRATSAYDTAVQNENTALESYNNLKGQYEALPDTDPTSGQPNPAKARLKGEVDKAKQKWEQAKEATVKAKQEKQKAEQAAEKAIKTREGLTEQVQQAQDKKDACEKDLADKTNLTQEEQESLKQLGQNVLDAQEKVNTARDNKKDMEIKQDVAKEAQDKAIKDYNQAEKDYKEFKKLQDQRDDLSSAIDKQQTRLKEMEDAENEKLADVDQTMGDMIAKNKRKLGKIGDDVSGIVDNNRLKGVENRNAKLDGLEQEKERLAKLSDQSFASQLSKQAISLDGGDFYSKGTNPKTGNTVYTKNGQMINKDEYDAGVKAQSDQMMEPMKKAASDSMFATANLNFNPQYTFGGVKFATGQNPKTGNIVYSVNGQSVSESEYQQQMKQAKEQSDEKFAGTIQGQTKGNYNFGSGTNPETRNTVYVVNGQKVDQATYNKVRDDSFSGKYSIPNTESEL